MGIFDSLDVASAPEIKYEVLKGKFPARIAEVVVGQSSKGNLGMSVKWDFDDETIEFQPLQWFQIPENMDSSTWDKDTILYYESGDPKPEKYNTEFKENTNQVAQIRRFLSQIGIPPEQMNDVDPEQDLEGIQAILTMGPQKNNPQYTEVKFVAEYKEGSSGATAPRSAPSAGIPAATATPKATAANPFAS